MTLDWPEAARQRYGWAVLSSTAYSGHAWWPEFFPLRTVWVCGACGGAGRMMREPYERCEQCKGTGYPEK